MPTPPTIEDLLVHAPFVRAVARAAVHGDADVDDLVQATWLATLERGPRHGASPRGWLATVARNAARALGRGEGRRHAREARAARPEGVPSTADIAAKEEVRRKLLDAVLGLDETYRDALLLRYYEDLPPREVAARLGVPVETARTRIKRGLALLRKRLDERWDGDRRAWAVAVAPLAGTTLGAAATAAGVGVLAKAAAAVLALGLLGAGGWLAFSGAKRPAPRPDPVELAASDDADAGPRLAPARRNAPRGGAVIRGTLLLDPGEGEVAVEAARIGPLEMVTPRRNLDAMIARVLSPPLAGETAATTQAAADGAFRLEGLSRGLYHVTARASDGFTRIGTAVLMADTGEVETTLDLRRGPHVLAGRVTNADGTPAAGWVYVQSATEDRMAGAWPTWPRGTPPRRLAADGSFRFEHLAAGPVALVVVDPGRWLLRRDTLPVPGDAPLVLVVGATATRPARVVDSTTGGGIGGADAVLLVKLRGDASLYITTARADDEGLLLAPDLGREVEAIVRADGYAPRRAEWDGKPEIKIRLERTARVNGRVADAAGNGIEGVTVHAYPLRSDAPAMAGTFEGTTDAAGHYDLEGVPPGEVMVFAHGGGWTSPRLAEVEKEGFNPFVHEAGIGEVLAADLVVVRAGRVEGRLEGPDGAGVGGATVAVQGEPWPDLRGPAFSRGFRLHATDDDGRFSIDTVLPGDALRVQAITGAGRRIESEPFALASGAIHEVNLRVGAAHYVDLRVVNEVGAPVAGARVLVVRERAGGQRVRTNAGRGSRTDTEGRLRIGPVAAPDVAVEVESDAYLKAEPVPITAAHRAGEPLEIVLRRGLTIAGRVTGPDGLDATTITVDLESQGDGKYVHRQVQADAEGRFRFETLPPQPYLLSASAGHDGSQWKAKAEVAETDEAVRLQLVRGAPLVVHRAQPEDVTRWTLDVRGPEGEPVPRVAHRLYFRFAGAAWHESSYGRGRPPVKAQSYAGGTDEIYVEVFGAQDDDGRPLPFGTALVAPRDLPAAGGELTVTLPREQHVRGRVLGPDGKGVAGVPLDAFADYGGHQLPIADSDAHSRTRTRSDGSFDLGRLGPFAYVLRPDLPDAYAPHEDVRVEAGDEDVVIRLRPSSTARIRVVDEAGHAVAQASVYLQCDGRTAASGQTDGEGLFVARGLDPERRYDVTAHVPGSPPSFLPQTIQAQSPGEVRIVLATAYTAAGVVVDEQGRPVPFASVLRQTSENGWETHVADADGRFSFGGLPAGEAVLMVTPALPLRWHEGTRHRVSLPSPDLRLVAELGAGIAFRLPDEVDPQEAVVFLTDEDDERASARFYRGQIHERRATIHGLDPEHRYVLYVMVNDRVFHATDLRPGPEVVDIALAPGRVVTVRLDAAGGLPDGIGWNSVTVTATGPGWRQHARLADPERPAWEIRGVPSGPCEIRATLVRYERSSNDPAVPPQQVGSRYEAVAEDVTADEVRLTLREVPE